MKPHRVPASVAPIEVYRYIRRAWPLLEGYRIRGAFQRKDIRINGARAVRGELIRGGDELLLYLPDALLSQEIKVIFDDGRLLVVEKPVGLPVDADRDGIGEDTVLARVRARYPSAALCHRLDTDTGGALLIALDGQTLTALNGAFKRGEIEKTYRAIVAGAPSESGSLTGYILKDERSGSVKIRNESAPGARSIRTDYSVIKAGFRGDAILNYVEIDLKTGRTHQIRAHFASVGWPLLGDDKYGNRALNKRYKTFRPCLWCVRLSIRAGGALEAYKGMRFESPDPFFEEAPSI